MFKMVKNYILSRLGESSSWRGAIALVAGSLGLTLSQDQSTSLIGLGMALVGVVGTFMPDKFGGDK